MSGLRLQCLHSHCLHSMLIKPKVIPLGIGKETRYGRSEDHVKRRRRRWGHAPDPAVDQPSNGPSLFREWRPPSSVWMPYSLETFAALATVVGTALSVLALIQSRAWLVITSLLCVGLAVAAGFYARRERLARAAASTVIEGHSIDSLNIANLRRRLDRQFVVQEAEHTARFEGEVLRISWKYSGYCRAEQVSEFYFSIDSKSGASFEDLDCVAYDLGHDPEMLRPIRPLLVGPDGVSKKISVPFLEPLKATQRFGVVFRCVLPRRATETLGYYTSTLSFSQERVGRCTVRLEFAGRQPTWMRVYDCPRGRAPVLVKALIPVHQQADLCEYVDVVEDVPGQSARVFMFWSDPA